MKQHIYNHSGKLLIAWILIIFVLCATPGQYIPSNTWLDLLSVDKLVHASIFFLLCFLFIVYNVSASAQRLNTVYIGSAILYGIALELMQAYCFSNRSMDWKDMIANTVGCLAALMLSRKIENVFDAVRPGS